MSQTNPIDQEIQAIHLKPANVVPWEGVLVKEKLFRFYRDQTDENAYLRSQLLDLKVPTCESDSSTLVMAIAGSLLVGLVLGSVALAHK
jgi:hypothetical protein